MPSERNLEFGTQKSELGPDESQIPDLENPHSRAIDRLLEVMACLRDPEKGCPWDLKQDFHTLIPYLIEECYEVIDAIEQEDHEHLKEELGDLLLQIVFQAQIAKEKGLFDFDEIAREITEKLIRRHPHVFEGLEVKSDEERKILWEKIKQEEKARKGRQEEGALAGVPDKLPALMAAVRLQEVAAEFGFDWPEAEPVFDKIEEELCELKTAYGQQDREQLFEEFGDLLFSAVNLARKLEIDPEAALRRACRKFKDRFHNMERRLKEEGKRLEETPLEELDRLWEESKVSK